MDDYKIVAEIAACIGIVYVGLIAGYFLIRYILGRVMSACLITMICLGIGTLLMHDMPGALPSVNEFDLKPVIETVNLLKQTLSSPLS